MSKLLKEHARLRRQPTNRNTVDDRKDQDESLTLNKLKERVPSRFFEMPFSIKDELTESTFALEKLGRFLDDVEVELFVRMSKRSNAFLGALATFEDMHVKVRDDCDRVAGLRMDLSDISDGTTKGNLRIVALSRKLRRLQMVRRKLRLLSAVRQSLSTIDVLISEKDFLSALRVIDETSRVIREEFHAVRALRNFGEKLALKKKNIGILARKQLISALETNSCSSEECDVLVKTVDLVSDVSTLFQEWRANELDHFRVTVKMVLKDCLKFIEQDDSSDGIGEWMRTMPMKDKIDAMTHEQFFLVLSSMTERVLEDCARLKDSLTLLNRYVKGHNTDMRDTLTVVHGLVVDEVQKLLELRQDAHCELRLRQLADIGKLLRRFLTDSSEALSLPPSNLLNHTFKGQVKCFLERFHEKKSEAVSLLVENDTWIPAVVPDEVQNLASNLLLGGEEVRDVEELSHSSSLDSDLGSKPTYIEYGGEKFAVTNTAQMMIAFISEYVNICDEFGYLGEDVLHKIVALLRQFNSKSCQMILGAGALHVGGLKSITTRHICVSAQSLNLLSQVVLRLRRYFESRIARTQAFLLDELDAVTRDLIEHRQELLEKVLQIMNERLESQCRSLAMQGWNSPVATGSEVSSPMKSLVKQLNMVRRVLMSILHPNDTRSLLGRVREAYSQKLDEEFSHFKSSPASVRKQMTLDVKYYLDNVSSWDDVFVGEKTQTLRDHVCIK